MSSCSAPYLGLHCAYPVTWKGLELVTDAASPFNVTAYGEEAFYACTGNTYSTLWGTGYIIWNAIVTLFALPGLAIASYRVWAVVSFLQKTSRGDFWTQAWEDRMLHYQLMSWWIQISFIPFLIVSSVMQQPFNSLPAPPAPTLTLSSSVLRSSQLPPQDPDASRGIIPFIFTEWILDTRVCMILTAIAFTANHWRAMLRFTAGKVKNTSTEIVVRNLCICVIWTNAILVFPEHLMPAAAGMKLGITSAPINLVKLVIQTMSLVLTAMYTFYLQSFVIAKVGGCGAIFSSDSKDSNVKVAQGIARKGMAMGGSVFLLAGYYVLIFVQRLSACYLWYLDKSAYVYTAADNSTMLSLTQPAAGSSYDTVLWAPTSRVMDLKIIMHCFGSFIMLVLLPISNKYFEDRVRVGEGGVAA